MTDKVTTCVFRCSFLELFKPKVNSNGKSSYGVTMIIDPTNMTEQDKALLEGMKRIVQQALEEKHGTKIPSFWRSPFRKGQQKTQEYPTGYDLNKYPEYEGMFIASARAYGTPPGVVDASSGVLVYPPDFTGQIVEPAEKERQQKEYEAKFYSGMYGRASVTAYWYEKDGNAGVGFSLQNFMKAADGEPLGGGKGSPNDDFAAFAQPAMVGANSDLFDL